MDFSIQEDDQAVIDLAGKILADFATNERMKAREASDAPHDEELWKALADAIASCARQSTA